MGISSLMDFELSELMAYGIRLVVNLATMITIISFWNKMNHNRMGFSFTLGMFNIITFLICLILSKVPMEMGFALGLFAVFGILRYRTESVSTKAMSYLFISIGIALINALSNEQVNWVEIMIGNGLIVIGCLFLERFSNRITDKVLILDSLDILQLSPKEQVEMIIDKVKVKEVKHIHFEEIDYVRDTVRLLVTVVE